MKKLVLGSLLALGTVFFFNACSKDSKDDPISTTSSTGSTSTTSSTNNSGTSSGNGSSSNNATDTVVVLNGVKWATRNVNTPGTFASKPEDAGMFYQWNSKVGWPSTGAIGSITATNGSTTWDGLWIGGYINPSVTDTWTSANDPSPAGWRVPTYAEMRALLDVTSVTSTWTTQNGIKGRKFTDRTTGNSIFIPASGSRRYNDASLVDRGAYGYCWTSKAYDDNAAIEEDAYVLLFGSSGASWLGCGRSSGRSIRPVAK